jgi:hypothetical protein
MVGKNRANRLRDFRRGETSGGHLIEQWLEQVVILPVKERDPRRAVVERLTKRQAPETRAQNDNVRIHLFHLGNNFRCAVDESKSSKLFALVTRWPHLQNARCLGSTRASCNDSRSRSAHHG